MSARAFIITPDLTRTAGGMRTSVPSLWRAAALHGIDARLYTPAKNNLAEDTHGWDGPPIWSAPIAGPRRFAWVPGMVRAIANEARAGSVISLHGLWMGTGFAASKLRRRANLPLIVHPHGMLDPWALRRSPMLKAITRMWFEDGNIRRAACIRALNREEARNIRWMGIDVPIAIIPNGVQSPATLPSRAEADAAFPALHGSRVMLFLSRLHPKKGLPELLDAWKSSAPRDWLLAIAGPDSLGHRTELEAQIARLEIADSVTFLGELDSDAKWLAMARADAFVLPSHSEGFPMAVLEAASAGRPVVLTRGCHFTELAAAGGAIEVETTREDLAMAVQRMTALSDADRAAMGEAGRCLVAARYRWDAIGKSMADVCNWIADGAPRPDCVHIGEIPA